MNRTYKNKKKTPPKLALDKLLHLGSFIVMLGCSYGQVVSAPVFTPSGNIRSAVGYTVSVTSPTNGTIIRYTLDNTEPDEQDLVVPVTGKVTIPRTAYLKARAWLGSTQSIVTSGYFEVVGDIAAGGSHSLALKTNGTILGWGFQNHGRLATGIIQGVDYTKPTTPLNALLNSTTLVSRSTGIAAGLHHSLMLYSDSEVEGGVYAFGLNTSAQLGNNVKTTPPDFYPVKVAQSSTGTPLVGAIQVSAADTYSAALMYDGKVMTWGDNTSGRLGRSSNSTNERYAGYVTTSSSATSFLTGIDQISAGGKHMLARTAGQIYVWGSNSNGQLGTGNTSSSSYAILNSNLQNITDIATGESHSATVRWDASNQGLVYCFGQRSNGRLGNNVTSSGNVSVPSAVLKSGLTPLTNIIEVACGPRHTLALDVNGNVWSWGNNADGELGDNTLTTRGVAQLVKDPSGNGILQNICRIAAGGVDGDGYSLALASNGSVYAWGANPQGQLGFVPVVAADKVRKLPVVVSGVTLTNVGPPVVTFTVPIVQVESEPGRCVIASMASDPDGKIDISHVKYNVNGIEKIALNTSPNTAFTAIYDNLVAGSYTYTAIAVDKSGIESEAVIDTFIIKPTVSVVALTPSIVEGLQSYAFRISRGSANSAPLSVNLTVAGNASPGVDYLTLPSTVVIPAGATYVDLSFESLVDSTVESSESVVISLPSNTSYTVGTNASASVSLIDGADTDADGLPDAWEIEHFGNISASATAILKPDGLTNLEKAQLGLNPNIDYSNNVPGKTETYQYDLTGRLKNTTTPVGNCIFNLDAEGNILISQ